MTRFFMALPVAVLFTLSSCRHAEPHKEQETKFLVTSPVLIDTVAYHEYVCQIHAVQHIEVRALEKGYLQNIYVDEGQLVKKGQLMFQITPIVYQAEMQTAEAEANYAQIEYLNTKALADSDVVSRNELALAKARLDKANALLDLAKAHLSFTEIRAPFDGIMDRFYVRLGSLVDEGELLTTLSDNSKVWVYFNVPEAEYLEYITKAKREEAAPVKLSMANNKLFDHAGIVETIEADFNNETGNIAFRATFPNPEGILRHGGTGNILMPVALNNALVIPQESTFDVLDKKFVYVVDGNDVVSSKEIFIETEMPHIYVVASGLTPSDKIVLEGLRKVKNNEKIAFDFVPAATAIHALNNLHAE